MRRGWFIAALGVVGACRFDPGPYLARDTDADVDADVDASDAAVDASPDAMPDAYVAPYCDATNPDLVACYHFDGDALDASANDLDAQTSNVTFVAGRVGMAMQFGATSAAEVSDSAALDVAALTVEAWIRPSSLPGSGARMGVADLNGQWGLFLYDGGNMRCTAVATATQTTGTITANQWHHVACTRDATTTTLYVDGVMVAQTIAAGSLSTSSTSGMSIAADNPAGSGSRLIGLIDELRIMSVARTATEICDDAGCAD